MEVNSNTACDTVQDHTLMVRTLEILWHCNERSDEAEQFGLQSFSPEGVTSIDWCLRGAPRLVTTGGDRCIRIWEVDLPALSSWMKDSTHDMTACTKHVSSLKSSWMPMTARWSPHGQLIASGHCDGKISLWWQERSSETGGRVCLHPETRDEIWKDFRHLSGHINDVYDLCFSPDSRYLLSGGGDGTVLVHDLEGSTMPVVQLTECHTKFCRGVAWDPWNRFLVTFGNTPSLQFFRHVPKRIIDKNCVRRMSVSGQKKSQGEYIGEACPLFFRRMSWSPDGLLLAVPFGKAGHVSSMLKKRNPTPRSYGQNEEAVVAISSTVSAKGTTSEVLMQEEAFPSSTASSGEPRVEVDMVHCVNLYTRNALDKLAGRIVIRGFSEVRGVSWAPCVLEPFKQVKAAIIHPFFQSNAIPHRNNSTVHYNSGGDSGNITVEDAGQTHSCGCWGPKWYRMALAAWTPDAVIVYTTSSPIRHSDFTDLHMRSITDVAWAPDASYLLTAGLDGYVSVIAFRDTLSITHRLPTFVSSPVVQSMCDIFEKFSKAGAEVENSYSKFTSQVSSSPVMAAVVKKKKRLETGSSKGGSSTLSSDQLYALISTP